MSRGLEERLRHLEDERSILRTLYAYGHAIDYGLEGEFLDCWVESAQLVWRGTPERELAYEERRFDGRAAIAEAFRSHTHAPVVFHKHLLHQPQITVGGDRASVESGFARLDETERGPLLRSFGRYRDVLVRCPDGRWRFERREAVIESSVAAGAPTARPSESSRSERS